VSLWSAAVLMLLLAARYQCLFYCMPCQKLTCFQTVTWYEETLWDCVFNDWSSIRLQQWPKKCMIDWCRALWEWCSMNVAFSTWKKSSLMSGNWHGLANALLTLVMYQLSFIRFRFCQFCIVLLGITDGSEIETCLLLK